VDHAASSAATPENLAFALMSPSLLSDEVSRACVVTDGERDWLAFLGCGHGGDWCWCQPLRVPHRAHVDYVHRPLAES
jgi:hypothetical protein